MLANYDDAMREYAYNVGHDRPDACWILTDYDVWVKNPFYKGAPEPHPEDYEYGEPSIGPVPSPELDIIEF